MNVRWLLGSIAVSLAAGATSCGGGGGSSADDLGLPIPHDVGKGGRIVYVLEDVSCDMEEPRDVHNRVRSLEIGSNAAAFDGGTVAMGVVRALASQNVIFESVVFQRRGSSATLRVDHALDDRDDALKRLRPLVNRIGDQPCESDLLGVLSETAREQKVILQRIGHDVRKDIVFATNGLIVDKRRHIVLTRTAIERPSVYAKTLRTIRQTWQPPDLDGFTIWLVGLGRDKDISTERGPAVIRLWRDLLASTHAIVKEPPTTADDLPPTLSTPAG